MSVIAIRPIVITPAMVVESSLFDTAPATYAAGTTYALGAYASVAGTLGEILIYKSLQAGNIGNTPSSSPTWWVYSSKTYQIYSTIKYAKDDMVIDPITSKVYKSLSNENCRNPIDGHSKWVLISKSTNYGVNEWVPAIETWNIGGSIDTIGKSYIVGEEVGITDYSSGGSIRVYKCLANSNGTQGPISTPANWAYQKTIGGAYGLYNPQHAYSIGDYVSYGEKDVYIAAESSNINNYPTAPVKWIEISPSNKTAFQDTEVSTQSIANLEMAVTIFTGVIDAIALIGIQGGTAQVTVRNGFNGTIVYDQTQGISGEIVADWWAFLYGDSAIPLRKIVFTDLPPYINGHVTVKIIGDGEVRLGTIAAGIQASIGVGASYGANIEVKDYSVKTTDAFGKTTFVKRGYKEVLELSVLLNKTDFNRVHNTFINLRSERWFLIVADDPNLSEALYMYGFYNSYRNVIEYPDATIYSLQFESLVS